MHWLEIARQIQATAYSKESSGVVLDGAPYLAVQVLSTLLNEMDGIEGSNGSLLSRTLLSKSVFSAF